jgi:hypothetical protein
MIGYLHILWHSCAVYAKDGNLSKYGNAEIAYMARWEGDAGVFVSALVQCGFINIENGGGLHVANWDKLYCRTEMHPTRIKFNSIRQTIVPIVFADDNYRCANCGSTQDLTVDHIIPVSKGGGNERSNLRTLCRPCNSSKGAKDG